jgi:hypothetical protein
METTTVVPYRLKVRLGNHEFEAEGPEESVKEQFSRFVELATAAKPTGNGNGERKNYWEKGADESGDERDPYGYLTRAFVQSDDRVSLSVLPQTKSQNADAIILLLYGYRAVLNRDNVQSTDLMDAAKQSGLRIDRIDRNLPAGHKPFVITGGSGKGTRYGLNNRGISYAQDLLEKLFE